MSNVVDDRVTVYLALESVDQTPAALTSRLSMPSDREWLMGDDRGKTGKRWASNGWVVETTSRSIEFGGRPASELIPIALKEFEARVAPFAKVAGLLGSSVQRYVVLAVLAEEIPGIELGHSFLQLLTDLGGTFQVDLNVQAPVS